MGKGINNKCNSCGYEEFVDLGEEKGFNLSANTYVCLDCKSLLQLSENQIKRQERETQSIYSRSEKVQNRKGGDDDLELIKSLSREDQDFLTQVFGIGICEHRHVKAWDDVKKPCPRCGSKMEDSYKLGFALSDE